MNKREFLKAAGTLALGAAVLPSASAFTLTPTTEGFTLPPLGYGYNALEPYIDAQTMEIHHSKHHQAYINNLNKAVADSNGALAGKSLEQLVMYVTADQAAVRNNAGGHWNHSMFWKWIAPGGAKAPTAAVAGAIDRDLGGFDAFKTAFSAAAKNRFGSGWAWLCLGVDGKLFISSTPNQDNPLMKEVAEKPGAPILGLDLWEHAYYLKYQNKRPDYIDAFFSLINWTEVEHHFTAAGGK